MNLFEYTAKSAYLDSLKHIHEIESELRSLLSNVRTTNYGERYTKSVINLDELTRPFMLYTKCLKLFKSRSTRTLPDFIYNTRREGATHIVERLSSYNYPITYAQYLDIFQYMNNESIILPHNFLEGSTNELNYLIRTIQDNVNPYKIDFINVRANSFYNSLANSNNIIACMLQAISMRQLDYNDKKYTVLEDFINVNFDKITVKLTVNDNYKINSEEYVKTAQDGLNASIEFHEIISKVNNA
jgi:hypothetical protein